MKSLIRTFRITVSLCLTLLLTTGVASADTFTAVASGNWTSNATWGLSAPGTVISNGDIVVIPPAITVTLDTDVELNSSLSVLTVNGTLSGANTLTVTNGNVAGTGSVDVNELVVGAAGTIGLTGVVTANTLTTNSSSLLIVGNVTVNDNLELMGGTLTLENGANLSLANNATVTINGGQMMINGGVFNGGTTYNVTYNGSSINSGIELTGSGLQNVMVSLNTTETTLTLTGNTTINGTLNLSQGELVLNSNNLSINGDIAAGGNGTITADANGSISITSSGNITGALNFTPGSQTMGDLAVDLSGNGTVMLGSNVEITGTMNIANGSISLNGNELTITGDVSATANGTITGSATSSVVVATTTGISGDLNFTLGGQMLEDLTIEVENNGSASLGSNLSVNGTLNLGEGSLNLDGNTLTLMSGADVMVNIGDIMVNGGTFDGSADYNLMVMSSTDIGLGVEATGSGLVDFTVNTPSANTTVTLNDDINVAGNLSLTQGILALNDNTLGLSGDIAAGGSGSIMGSVNSNITIATATDVTGALSFNANGNNIGDLTIDIADGGNVNTGSNITVEGALSLINGTVSINDNMLALGANASIIGGSNSSYVVTNGSGSVMIGVTAGGPDVAFPVGTATNFSPAIITQASGAASGDFMVNVMSGVYSEGTTGIKSSDYQSVVNATWNVASSLTTDIDMTLEVWWDAAMELNGFDRTNAYISHYVNGSWDVTAATSATATANSGFGIERSGITSLSPFSVTEDAVALSVDNVESIQLSIYPNPFDEFVLVQLVEAPTDEYRYEVYDLTGKVIHAGLISDRTTEIGLNGLASGAYVLRIVDSNQQVQVTERIMKP